MLFCLLVLVLVHAVPAYAQHRIEGRVTDALSGEGLSGVQVQVQGTAVGTLSDQDGRYQLVAPTRIGTLQFTRIGYETQRAAFNNQNVINVQMASAATELEEIVVVGYGQRSRANLTESVGTVSAQEIQRVTVASPDAAIQGRVTGVQVTAESGTPGAPVAMRIRGVGTVGNTQPLFVIDGVPVGKGVSANQSPLATINPNDIESISILKDASAASVYGMQAANGVVLITTRRGALGAPTIRYDAYTGIQRMPGYYEVLSTPEWLALQQEAIDANNAYFQRTPSDPAFVQLPPQLRQGAPERADLLARNTDWARIGINGNAPITNHNVSISGASEQVNYYVSGGFFQQEALIGRWDLTRYTFRANSDFNINRWLRMGETFTVSNQVTDRGASNYGDASILANVVSQPPVYLAYDQSLVSPSNPQGLAGNFGTLTGWPRSNMNSVDQLQEVTDRTTRLLGGVYAEASVLPGLTLRTQNSVDYNIGNQYLWQPTFTNAVTGYERPELAADFRNEGYSIVSTNTATYANSFGNHNLNVLGGVETNMFRSNGVSMEATGFISTDLPIRRLVALGDRPLARRGSASEVNRLGYIGRLNYNYGDRYLFTGSVRRDGVSTFAPGQQWGMFPAFSAGWRVSQEPWFNVGWINELKVRGSWGQLGNSDVPGGAYPQYVGVNLWVEYMIGNQLVVGPTPASRLANPQLTWETNTTMDFGFESVLFNNSIDLAATYYTRDTENFLVNIPVPVASGFTSAPFNVGLVTNSGLELEAGYNTRLRDAVDLRISGNLTTVKNRLVALTEGLEEFQQSGFYRTSVGQPIGYFYGFQTCGVFQTAADAANSPRRPGNQPGAGDLCFRDINGRNEQRQLTGQPDGQLNDDDRTYLGKTIPDAFYGINFNAGFRGFDFTAFFTGVTGVQRFNALRAGFNLSGNPGLETMAGGGANQLATVRDRWTPTNPSNTTPRAIAGDPAGNNRLSDRWVEDGDFFRLKTLQFGYNLPDNLLGTGIRGTRLYVSGTNLWTRTSYSGLDPEFSSTPPGSAFGTATNQSQLQAGTDFGNIPQPRMFQIGVTTTF